MLQSIKKNFFGFFTEKSRNKEVFPERPDITENNSVFVQFPCQVCQTMISIPEIVLPGDVAVTTCSNCNASWTIYCPSLLIRKTKEIPSEIQSSVWSKLSEKNR